MAEVVTRMGLKKHTRLYRNSRYTRPPLLVYALGRILLSGLPLFL